jgi:hypothetical protein
MSEFQAPSRRTRGFKRRPCAASAVAIIDVWKGGFVG